MSSTTLNRIKSAELFKGCGRLTLKLIDGLGTTVALRGGRTLCSQGEPGSEFFVLLDGDVDIRKPGQRIAQLHGGGWFGETALIHNVGRQASVTSAGECTVMVFDRREFSSLCSAAPLVRERLEQTAALYLCGEEPLSESWYEPACRRVSVPNARGTTPHWPSATPAGTQRTVRMQGSARLI